MGKKLRKLGMEGLLLLKNNGLVGQNGMHVNAKGLHIMCDEDSVLLGLIPESIKALSKGEHRVLEVRCGIGGSCLRGLLWWWWRWVGRELPYVPLGIAQGSKAGLIVMKLVLVRGLMAGIVSPLRLWYTRFVPLN